jgi:L-alanine-DL-glutamate epimerase-like enolase superfamily enzyme
MVHGSPPFYGSALGLSLQHAHVMHEVLSSSYRIVKWSLNFEISIDEQLLAISRLGVPWTSIALDAHGRLTVEETRTIQDFAPELAWLEDPFPSADDENWNRAVAETSGRIPRLVVGEDVFSVERIEDLAILPVVHAVNLEVERLGITRSIHLFHGLMARSQTCHLHGRALVPSSHLALAFPSIVRWVECHLAFGFERLATIEGAEPSADPRAIVNYCLNQKGIGVKPTARAGFSNEVLDVPL